MSISIGKSTLRTAIVQSISNYTLVRLYIIWLVVLFTNCACTTTLDMPATKKPPKIEKVPKKEYKIIRVDPSLRMPIADQIKWAKALSTMPLEEKKKILMMLLDDMFSDLETLEREGKIYPKKKNGIAI